MSRSQVLVSVLGGLVGLAFAVGLFLNVGPDTSASTQVRGYVVQSDTAVEVQWEVAREPGSQVYCVLRARGESGLEVGRREVDVAPSSQRSTVERAVVPTTERAVTGELVGCTRGRADGPSGVPPSP